MDELARSAWEAARPGDEHAVAAVCIAPWVSLELDPSGWVYGCCANQQYPLGRIGGERLRDIWGGPRAEVLREALSRWDMSVGCGSCRWHLEHGRMDPDAAVYDRYPLTDPHPPGPAAMTFALSNRCNLACVMCTPELSSTLRHQAGMAPLSSPYDDQFFEDLSAFLPGLRYAKFLGGEPFLIPEHHRVWDLMAQLDSTPRMQVTTNGTIWNQRVEMVLDTFDVDVTVSFDAATASTYERIRGGSDFDAVVANMARFAAHCAAAGTEFRICFCLMDLNWHELPGLLSMADGLGAAVSINVVSDIGLALHDLPFEQLERVAAAWAADDTEFGPSTVEVWQTQVNQLDAVLSERRAGVPPAPRQAQRAPEALLDTPDRRDASGVAEAEVTAQVARLAEWSGGGPVARLELGPDGEVVAVAAPHARLGIDDGIEGCPVQDLLRVMEARDGRAAWLIGIDQVGDAVVRVVALSHVQPVRGVAGSIVRTVLLPVEPGWTLLVAEDRIYDLVPDAAPAAEVPVRMPLR